MADFKRILVATDLSERSDRALQRAVQIARAQGAALTVISVVDEDMPAKIVADMTERTREHLAGIVPDDLAEVEVRVEAGMPTETLLRHINEGHADLAVLGLHRRRAVFDGFRQTTMERLVAGARVPVLLASGMQREKGYARVLAPVAFSPACAEVLRVAQRLAREAEFELFHAWMVPFSGYTGGPKSDFGRQIRRELSLQAEGWHRALGLALPRPDLIDGGLGDVFARRTQAFKPDLIAVGAHTRAGPALHRLGGFAADLIRDPPADVLIARGPGIAAAG